MPPKGLSCFGPIHHRVVARAYIAARDNAEQRSVRARDVYFPDRYEDYFQDVANLICYYTNLYSTLSGFVHRSLFLEYIDLEMLLSKKDSLVMNRLCCRFLEESVTWI